MALDPLHLMEPEETVGNFWHSYASGLDAPATYQRAAVKLDEVRQSLGLLFHALGGAGSVELVEAPPVPVDYRRSLKGRLGNAQELRPVATYDGDRLRLPGVMDCFDERSLNRAAYFWLTVLAALSDLEALDQPDPDTEPYAADLARIAANVQTSAKVLNACPGLREHYRRMVRQVVASRPRTRLPGSEAAVEQAVRRALERLDPALPPCDIRTGRYRPFAPVPIWLHLTRPRSGRSAASETQEAPGQASAAATAIHKRGFREDREQAERRDSFILHRFEAILSWVESMNLARSVDDNDQDDAKQAAEDQDSVTLSPFRRRAATRLRLHLDLSPADADHERLAAEFTYPEWDHRSRSYLESHCRVLETDACTTLAPSSFRPDTRGIRAVRRQFETLRPRRVLRSRQLDGSELDLDALIAMRAELQVTGRGSDRVYRSVRQIERDLAVAFLVDTSRSTETAVEGTCVIDVARDALAAMAAGIDAIGDRLGIWGFSSLRRDRVFLTRCKGFDTPFSAQTTTNICALTPGHYTRLGAAIRHASAMLAREASTRKLLVVLTDGKPNDLDHYEGQYGIEDSHMAVREARGHGQTVHGVIIDEDRQYWFARIFERGGFSLLPNPERLPRALPDIYRSLTQET